MNRMSYRPCPRCNGEGELVTADIHKGAAIYFCDFCSKLYSLIFTREGELLEAKS